MSRNFNREGYAFLFVFALCVILLILSLLGWVDI